MGKPPVNVFMLNIRLYFWLNSYIIFLLQTLFMWFYIEVFCYYYAFCVFFNDLLRTEQLYVTMVSATQMARLPLCYILSLWLFWHEIVLKCIVISVVSLLQVSWKVLIFSSISLIWKIVSETELGERCASLNWEEVV